MSDEDAYSVPLAKRLGYTNTFLHKSPRFDILDPPKERFRDLDFLIASDVFEHVVPPVQVAFENARGILRTGGLFVFSVPFVPGKNTIEHFPNLYRYRVERVDQEYVLLNTTRDGQPERFSNLIFHGGPGQTLEMRLFGLEDIVHQFEYAGFRTPEILTDSFPKHGLDYQGEHCSIPMITRAV